MPASELVITGGWMLDASGSFVEGEELVVRDGAVIARGPRAAASAGVRTGAGSDARVLDLAGRWLMPGVIDVHDHIAWNAFHAEDRELQSPAERRDAAAESLAVTLRAGVTSVRDAGGADAALRDDVARGILAGPRLSISVRILDEEGLTGDGVDDLRARVRRVIAEGADWIKLAATGGISAPGPLGPDVEPTLTTPQITAAIAEARAAGVPVMVHAWGGQAVTDAIAAGARSIEHAIFLTERQAQDAAAAGTAIVPTLTIYREVAALAEAGALPAPLAACARAVAQAHPESVRRARDAGARLALGSDFGTPDQHGRNLAEITALAQAGLGVEGALVAATRGGATLLGDALPGTRGLLEVGGVADAIVLERDPSDVTVFERPDTVGCVLQAGIIVAGEGVTR